MKIKKKSGRGSGRVGSGGGVRVDVSEKLKFLKKIGGGGIGSGGRGVGSGVRLDVNEEKKFGGSRVGSGRVGSGGSGLV